MSGRLPSVARGARLADLGRKAFGYFVAMLSRPRELPAIVNSVSRGAHLGEILKLREHRLWIANSGINTLIDVGAHTGEFCFSLRQFLPDAQIYAFEPQQGPYHKLTKRFSTDVRFSAFRTALGDGTGELSFYESSFSKASSPLIMAAAHKEAFPWSGDTSVSSVPVSHLDDHLGQLTLPPNVLLKLDVQGYEDRVLRGASQTLSQTAYVLVEISLVELYEGQADFQTIYTLLADRGFRYAGNWDQLTSPLDQSTLQVDAFFVRTR